MKNDAQTTGAKPVGIKGRLAGVVMNAIHTRQYNKAITQALREIGSPKGLAILDIGCGGGKAVNLFYDIAKDSRVYGVDHSPDMVSLARRVNKASISSGRADIVQGDVAGLPYGDDSFDIAAAFDTINFWTDIDKAMSEVYRVLKAGGMFFIINGYPRQGTKWWDFVKFKNDEEYISILQSYNFERIQSRVQTNTIMIKAYKGKEK